MKTPRELLLDRHASVEPQLDALRRRALDAVPHPAARTHGSADRIGLLRTALAPWSRHAFGLLAAWTVIVVLQFQSERPGTGEPTAPHTLRNPHSLLAQMEAHRRQIRELLSPEGELPSPTTAPTPSLLWHRRPTRSSNTA